MLGENMLQVPTASVQPAAAPAAATAQQEAVFWRSIMNSTNAAEYEAYLMQFPNGVFRALAQARLAALRAPAAGRPGPGSPGSGSRPAGTGDAPTDASAVRPGIPGDQVCTPQPDGSPCWMEVSYRPGCYVWNPYPKPDETVTWTGACADGLAEGTGTQTWSYSGVQETGTGLLRSGRAHGTWDFVFSLPDGSSIERQIEFDNGTQVR